MRTKINVKHIAVFGAIALLLALALVAFPSQGTASAHTAAAAAASCTYNGCDHKSPVSTGCQNTAVVEHWESGTIDNGIGITIQLQFSTACHAAWGRVVFSRTLPSGYYGYADLWHTTDNVEVTCNSAGGDGNVLPGQSVCYTPMLGDGPSQSTIATGIYCSYGCTAPVVTKAF